MQNRAKLTKIGGVHLFRSICVLFILPRLNSEQVSSKQGGPVSTNINKRPSSRSLFWSILGPFPLLDPCYGQYTMLRNLHGPVSPNIYNRPPFQTLLATRQVIRTFESPVMVNLVRENRDREGGFLFILGLTGPCCFDEACSLFTRGSINKTQIDLNRGTPPILVNLALFCTRP